MDSKAALRLLANSLTDDEIRQQLAAERDAIASEALQAVGADLAGYRMPEREFDAFRGACLAPGGMVNSVPIGAVIVSKLRSGVQDDELWLAVAHYINSSLRFDGLKITTPDGNGVIFHTPQGATPEDEKK